MSLPNWLGIMVYGVWAVLVVYWVMPKSVADLLAAWHGCFEKHRNGIIWKAALHCVMWCIWRERNAQSFEDIKRNIPDFKLFFLRTLLDWMSARDFISISSICDLMDICNLGDFFFGFSIKSYLSNIYIVLI